MNLNKNRDFRTKITETLEDKLDTCLTQSSWSL